MDNECGEVEGAATVVDLFPVHAAGKKMQRSKLFLTTRSLIKSACREPDLLQKLQESSTRSVGISESTFQPTLGLGGSYKKKGCK